MPTPTGGTLREKLRAGEPTLGGWVQIPHPAVAALLASSGLDWVALDLEHGVIDLQQAATLLQTIRCHGAVPLVRMEGIRYDRIKQLMDAGAEGIIAPMVATPAHVQEVIDGAKYPPDGRRGVGYCPANLYGFDFNAYIQRANADTLIALQIEHIDAIHNLDTLLASPAVDAAFLGPYDLSASMGVTGQFDHPRYVQALAAFRDACARHRVAPGIHCVTPNPADVLKRIDEGYRMIAYSLDATLLGSAARQGVAAIREGIAKR